MSGIKAQALTELHRALRAQGESVGSIAGRIFSSRAHVSQVLSGRRPGSHTWRKLRRVLTASELELIARQHVPRGANCHVEREGAP